MHKVCSYCVFSHHRMGKTNSPDFHLLNYEIRKLITFSIQMTEVIL